MKKHIVNTYEYAELDAEARAAAYEAYEYGTEVTDILNVEFCEAYEAFNNLMDEITGYTGDVVGNWLHGVNARMWDCGNGYASMELAYDETAEDITGDDIDASTIGGTCYAYDLADAYAEAAEAANVRGTYAKFKRAENALNHCSCNASNYDEIEDDYENALHIHATAVNVMLARLASFFSGMLDGIEEWVTSAEYFEDLATNDGREYTADGHEWHNVAEVPNVDKAAAWVFVTAARLTTSGNYCIYADEIPAEYGTHDAETIAEAVERIGSPYVLDIETGNDDAGAYVDVTLSTYYADDDNDANDAGYVAAWDLVRTLDEIANS